MNDPRKLYWDSSCFICLLNDADYERARRAICEDILYNAQHNAVQIWTSTYAIAEVIRPKRHGSAPLPEWAIKAIAAVEKEFPQVAAELPALWKRYQSNDPTQKLTNEQIALISSMFEWPFIKLIELNEPIAFKAVELARDYGLKPADSVHAASAIIRKVDVLQRWNRDFSKVAALIDVKDPEQISPQANMFAAAPRPENFTEQSLFEAETKKDNEENKT